MEKFSIGAIIGIDIFQKDIFMKKTEDFALIKNSAFLLFSLFFLLISWPFLLNIQNQPPEFLFYYFFTVWGLFIVSLFFVIQNYKSADADK